MQVTIRPLAKADLAEADRIFRLAFGTFVSLPDPMSFAGTADYVRSRWLADPSAAFGAYNGDDLVGSSFSANWGSFGVFGPVTVRPDFWDKGVAKRLLDAAMALFDEWRVRQAALLTFPQSPKHIALYQKFGFWPQFLTAIMSKAVDPPGDAGTWSRYSRLSPEEQRHCLKQCADLTGAILPGLNVEREVRIIEDQAIGETVLLRHGETLAGFATCHVGKGSEAESLATTYVKFAAVRPGSDAPDQFGRLLVACEALAAEKGSTSLVAGVNTARYPAYRAMVERGFRTLFNGVAMQRPNEAGFNRPDCFVIDDWR